MRLRNPMTGERVVIKDESYIERLKSTGWEEQPKPKPRFEIPYGSLHECCLCDVVYRHGIDYFRCPHPPPENGVEKS